MKESGWKRGKMQLNHDTKQTNTYTQTHQRIKKEIKRMNRWIEDSKHTTLTSVDVSIGQCDVRIVSAEGQVRHSDRRPDGRGHREPQEGRNDEPDDPLSGFGGDAGLPGGLVTEGHRRGNEDSLHHPHQGPCNIRQLRTICRMPEVEGWEKKSCSPLFHSYLPVPPACLSDCEQNKCLSRIFSKRQ